MSISQANGVSLLFTKTLLAGANVTLTETDTTVTISSSGGSGTFATVTAGLGAVGAPSYTFTGDSNTGMWSPGGDIVAWSTAGSERMRVTATGNVGIGTTTPGVLLEVNGAMTAQGNIFAASGGTTRTITLGPAGAGLEYNTDGTTYLGGRTDAYPLVFRTNSAERLRITSTGNIGIGTAIPANKLSVVESTGNSQVATAAVNRTLPSNPSNNLNFSNLLVSSFLDANFTSAPNSGLVGINNYFQANTSGANTNAYNKVLYNQFKSTSGTGSINLLNVNQSTVEIGGGSQSYGTITISDSSTAIYGGSGNITNLIYVKATKSILGGYTGTITNQYGVYIDNMATGATNNYALYSAGGTNYFGGNVGIGTASPLAKLEVKGSTLISTTNSGNNILGFNDVAFAGGTLNGAPDGASGSAFIVGNGSTASGAPSYLSMWTTNGGVVSERMRITSTGNVGIGTASPTAKLEVNNGDIAAGNAANNFRIVVSRTGANPASLVMGAFTDSPAIEFTGALGLRFLAGLGGTEVIRIRNNNLGIGTDNPLSKLVISNSGAQGFEFDPSTGIFQVYNRSTSAYGELRPYGSIIRFFTGTSPSERMRLDASGNLGIGTATPTVKLEVNGQIRTEAPTGGTAANWRLGTVHAVTPTSPNRTIEVDIGGTIYYLHAKTTND